MKALAEIPFLSQKCLLGSDALQLLLLEEPPCAAPATRRCSAKPRAKPTLSGHLGTTFWGLPPAGQSWFGTPLPRAEPRRPGRGASIEYQESSCLRSQGEKLPPHTSPSEQPGNSDTATGSAHTQPRREQGTGFARPQTSTGPFSAGERKNSATPAKPGGGGVSSREKRPPRPARGAQAEVNFPLKTHLVPKSAPLPYGQPVGSAEPQDAQKRRF